MASGGLPAADNRIGIDSVKRPPVGGQRRRQDDFGIGRASAGQTTRNRIALRRSYL